MKGTEEHATLDEPGAAERAPARGDAIVTLETMRTVNAPDRDWEAELDATRRELARVRAALREREELLRFFEGREAFRFAQTLIEVKSSPWRAWMIPIHAAMLAMPKPLRERVRGLLAARHEVRPDRALRPMRGAIEAGVRVLERGSLVPQLAKGVNVAIGPVVVNARHPLDRPLVTVVMPCFNYGHFLHEALTSLDRQTLQDFEVVLVEGGSTDGTTRDVVARLEHPKVRKIFQPSPTRLAPNRLAGLEAARGRFALFLDPDDALEPTYLEKAAMALELTGADVAYPSVQLFGREGGIWETADTFSIAQLATGNTIAVVAMFRLDSWRRFEVGCPTDSALEPAEDWDLWLRFAKRGARGWKIREPLMRYRVHAASQSQVQASRLEAARKLILDSHREDLTSSRIAAMSRRQTRWPLVARPLANLERVRRATAGTLHVALANPFLVVGGSDNLLMQIFGDAARRDASVSVFSTETAPANMGTSAPGYRAITDDVFELPAMLPPSAHADAIVHLLRSRRADVLLITGSTLTTRLLPRLRRELPHLRVVDHLYNTVGHLERNREFKAHIDFHVVANEEVRQALLDHGEAPERIRVIHHGIDMGRFDPAREPRRPHGFPELALAPDEALVLYAGRLSPEKGVLRFVEIASQLRDLRATFAMIGDGPEYGAVDAAVRRAGLQERVRLLGFVDAQPFLRRADVVVIPSDVEGLPLVSLESLAMGTPIVASRVGALPRLVQEGRTGFVVAPTDVAGFAAAIRKALALDPDRERLARRCRDSVVDEYSIEAVRDRYFDVFRALRRGERPSSN